MGKLVIHFTAYLIISLVLLSACNNGKGITPEVGNITESVYASGKVKADAQYKVFSSVPGIIFKRHVNVGDVVGKGDQLFTILNPTAQIAIENSELAVMRSEENMKKVKELERHAELLKNKYNQDSLMFTRQKKLWEKNIGTKVQYEQMQLAMTSSKTEYENIISELNHAKATLMLDNKIAVNNASITRKNASDFIVRSEVDGVVYAINPEEGEGVFPQNVLAIIGKKDSFLIEVQIDENDISRVKRGQEIFVTLDSYKGKAFKGVVTIVHPMLNENAGTFTVEGAFVNKPEKLYPNLNLEANILIAKKNNVLLIPREYLLEDSFVLMEDKKKVKIEVGLKNYEFVEVVKGLTKEQIIYKPE